MKEPAFLVASSRTTKHVAQNGTLVKRTHAFSRQELRQAVRMCLAALLCYNMGKKLHKKESCGRHYGRHRQRGNTVYLKQTWKLYLESGI